MSEIITFPLPAGPNYVIPDVGDENWGQNVTDFLVNLPLGVPPTSGTFTLTGDLSFGPSFGLISQYYKTSLINPASSGLVRLAKTDTIDWRNNANTGNLILGINGSDQLTLNGTPIVASTTGNLTDAGTDGIVITGGTGAVLGTGTSIAQHVADASHNGYLSSTDWSTFNGKQDTITFPLSVSNGGTGDSSLSAYAVLCGGTTSTGPVQQVSGTGLSGQALVSNGGAALPSWQTITGSGTVNSGTINHLAYYPASSNAVSSSVFLINNSTGDFLVPGQLTIVNGAKFNSAGNASIIQSANIATSDRTWTIPDLGANQTFAAFGQLQYLQPAVQFQSNSSAVITATSFTTTVLTATITPTSSSSRIKITIHVPSAYWPGTPNILNLTILKNGTDILSSGVGFFQTSLQTPLPIGFTYIDSPATTSALTYSLGARVNTGSASYNAFSCTATIILEELR